jgi:hypothetical protein
MPLTTRIMLVALFVWAMSLPVIATPAFALGTVEDYLKCPMSEEIRSEEEAIGWWNRRSEHQQRVVLSLPCEERFVPIVCIFLYDPDLDKCTSDGLSEYRANKSCQAQGHELLSQSLEDCKQEFKKTNKPPLSHTTS